MRDLVLGSEKLRMILMLHSAHFARRAFHMKGEKYKQKTPPDPAASKEKTLMFALTSDATGGTTTEKGGKTGHT